MNELENFVKKLIVIIETEVENSSESTYVCLDGTEISTDVGYVYQWFEKYKKVLLRMTEEKKSDF